MYTRILIRLCLVGALALGALAGVEAAAPPAGIPCLNCAGPQPTATPTDTPTPTQATAEQTALTCCPEPDWTEIPK